MLAVKQDNIILEGRKLFANLPRFNRDSPTQLNTIRRDGLKLGGNSTRTIKGVRQSFHADGGRNYAEALNQKYVEKEVVMAESSSKLMFLPLMMKNVKDMGKHTQGRSRIQSGI